MKNKLLVRVICAAAVLALSFSTVLGAEVSHNLLKFIGDTTVWSDPGLRETYGVLAADSVVYANEYIYPAGGSAVLEIVFCQDFIIRTGYIPLMAAVKPLTDAEAEEYASRASEGIVYRPGVVLLNVSDAGASESGTGFEVLPSDPSGAPEAAGSAEAAGTLPAEPVSGGQGTDSFEVMPADGAAVTGFVKTVESAMVFKDPDLRQTAGVLPSGLVVYADSPVSENDVVKIVFCVDYIIRTAYIHASAVAPLTDPEAADYAQKAYDGIVYRPGVALLNTSFLTGEFADLPEAVAGVPAPAAETPAPDTAAGVPAGSADSFEVSDATAVPTPVPTPEPTATPVPTPEPSPEPFPANPEIGTTVPLPAGNRYLLNPEDPIPRGTSISTIVMKVFSPGLADGVIDFAVLDDDVYVVVSSIPFSQTVASGAEKCPIRASYTCTKKTYVLIRFSPSCTCSFTAKASRRGELIYFTQKYSVFLHTPVTIKGYTVDCQIR